MGNLKELEISEMKEISGGNVAYEVGYILGLSIHRLYEAFSFALLFY